MCVTLVNYKERERILVAPKGQRDTFYFLGSFRVLHSIPVHIYSFLEVKPEYLVIKAIRSHPEDLEHDFVVHRLKAEGFISTA